MAIMGRRAKQRTEHTFGNLCLNTSILFKKRIIDVRRNHLELMTDSNRTSDSAIRFYNGVSQIMKRRRGKERDLRLFFQQDLVVLAQRCAEDDGRHRLETMDPLFALRSLASYVEHVYSASKSSSAPYTSRRRRKDIRQLAHSEPRLRDSDAFLSCSQNISDVGEISRCSYPQHFSKEAVGRVSGIKVQGREINTDYCAESIR